MEEAREKEFAAFLMEKFPPGIRGTSGVYWQEYGEKITATIKDPSSSDKNLRYSVKKNKYELLNIASLGARDVLVPAMKKVYTMKIAACICSYKCIIV